MNRKLVLTAVATFIGTTLFWAVVVLGLGAQIFDDPPFRLSLDYPNRVELGDTLTVELDITNADRSEIILGSIDVHDSLLEGFELIGIAPPYVSQSHVFTFSSYWYLSELSGLETVTLSIELRAIQEGQHHGQLEICSESESCTTTYLSIEVVGNEAG